MIGARIFVAIAFVILGASFIASTGLLIYEFRELDWLTMVVAHSHLFLFFPILGILALIAFFRPSVVLTHLYWNHVAYGKARFIFSAVVLAGLSYVLAWYLDREPRAIYEVSPSALLAEQSSAGKGRVAVLDALSDLRETAQSRFGLSSFGRSCVRDPLLETPEEMLKERYCFPAGKKLTGEACCSVQEAFGKALLRLQQDEATRSLSGKLDAQVLLPIKTLFILVVVAIAVMLAFWRNRIDREYHDLVPTVERGVISGALGMMY